MSGESSITCPLCKEVFPRDGFRDHLLSCSLSWNVETKPSKVIVAIPNTNRNYSLSSTAASAQGSRQMSLSRISLQGSKRPSISLVTSRNGYTPSRDSMRSPPILGEPKVIRGGLKPGGSHPSRPTPRISQSRRNIKGTSSLENSLRSFQLRSQQSSSRRFNSQKVPHRASLGGNYSSPTVPALSFNSSSRLLSKDKTNLNSQRSSFPKQDTSRKYLECDKDINIIVQSGEILR